ncbi:hypothetical protein AB0J21_07190 [Streptomyces sp. NPDC049954]|uniref:hypothetical protein n=1 Tax=Streptomyces sp. NPDC049954 TaxID=3155779 RepID=UPI00343A722F
MSGLRGRAEVDELLAGAEVLHGAYPAAEARRRLSGAPVPPPPPASAVRPAPDLYPSAHEQAAHDLDLAVALVVDAPAAAPSLGRLLDTEGGDPHGALVFGALLHLTRAGDAAAYWWRFAAEGGSRTAAFCLALLHRSRAEFRDAEQWRERSRRTAPPAPGSRRPAVAGRGAPPGLSEEVRNRLLAQCRERRHPSLPAALESVVNRLPTAPADEEYGVVPRPDASLNRLLTSPGPASATPSAPSTPSCP